MVMEVVRARRANPRFGPKKLRAILLREFPFDEVPSVKTIDRILRRCGEPRMKRRVRKQPLQKHVPKVLVRGNNDLWTIDFKGWWRTGVGQRVHPLTVRDAYSRFVLAVEVLPSQRMEPCREVLLDLFRRYGLPKAIQSDNGSPFGCTQARGGLTRLSAWLVSLGVRVVFSRPAKPQDNGGHERMHLDLSRDVEHYPQETLELEQEAVTRWSHDFNHHRPHESLGQKTPADVYRPSARRLVGPPRMPPYGPRWRKRTVCAGRISIDGDLYHVGGGLNGHVIGLQPIEGTRVRLWLHDHDLGELDLALRTFRRPSDRPSWVGEMAAK
jgi:transposase InsO family protein